jgi:3-deoxy-D-manno-octulosonate 8-phosphate phosphatase (KDO 8-P phosphatase)
MTMTLKEINERAAGIRLVLSDVDGVLTDGGVFYGPDGEVMKRFNIRDGMGVERLRAIGVEVGLITGEKSESVSMRAVKLDIEMVHLYCKDKPAVIREIIETKGFTADEIAYIGDDVNDLEAIKMVGLSAAPADAFSEVKEAAAYICRRPGGHGAFRELAELIIEAKKEAENSEKKSFGFQFE